ncbi:MAG: J domain-containing protein [Chitinophagaceae bacterium]
MHLKDYYSILELPASASGDEIRKAYRRLAHQYHPDKKNNDPYAAAQFSDIKEAYEILSNPAKKDYYLQQRWYAQSIGKKIKQETITPVTILKQMLELDRYISKLDVHRTNQEDLFNQVISILSDENIDLLNSFNDRQIKKEIILLALNCGNALSYHYAVPLTGRLKRLITTEESFNRQFDHFILQHKQANYWEKKKIWIVVLIVLLICLVIYFAGK